MKHIIALVVALMALGARAEVIEADVCIYGGTSGGVAAAVQASRMGKRAVIAEPGRHLGGMTAGGLSAVDIGDPRTVGGIAREYFTRLVATYGQTLEWNKAFESKGGGPATGGAYSIEPHVAERVFNEMVREAKVPVHLGARLASVKKDGARIVEFATENGAVFRAKMFIDATYEGDLMAKAGVSYTLMREGNAKYGETYNGIHYSEKYLPRTNHLKPGPTGRVTGGQGVWDRDFPLDPFVVPGDAKSGLLPLVQAGEPGTPGEPAPGVQAYCFRLCLTTKADRIPIAPPPDYDAKRYEIVARFIAACLAIGDDMDLRWFSKHDALPNAKWDFNTATFGGNLPGASWEWPEASYARREQIAKEHENYHRGLLHFLATDPRVPAKVRDDMKRFGLPRDEFTDNNGWPHQLYIREARRMVSDLVLTEHHTFGRKIAPDSIGLGSYGTDTHEIRRIVKDGVVQREGKTAGGRDGAPPYPIGYGAIVPRASECENLFVTFALSASHTAFSSIRMEPVFMVTSQSAATAACLAIDDSRPAQKVDQSKLRERLLKDGQVLQWQTTAAAPLYESDFKSTRYGRIPDGWRDLIADRPSRNWAVDAHGFVRPMLKLRTGLLVYDGYTADVKPARVLADARLVAEFKMTEDEAVAFGIAGRVVDRDNFYLARFSAAGRLELLKVKDGKELALDFAKPVAEVQTRPTGLVTLRRYREGERWKLSLTLDGELLTAVVFDAEGHEQARLAAIDGEFQRGHPGLRCTPFAAASSFRVEALKPVVPKADAARLAKRNAVIASEQPDYPVVRPHWQTRDIDTPREKLAASYDIIVAGAGTGGWAAALQAARMGARVLLLEETDWIGGQMCAAAVTTMDEDSVWMKFPVRERGIYREFHESMIAHYQTLDKDPFVAYYGYPEQHEGGYEPKAARAVLYGFIKEARERKAVLDVSLRTRVAVVRKSGDTVTGATVGFADGQRKDIACKVLIDATEYGDVVPLTGARYRVGNCTSEKLDPAALVQDHTWTAVVREYPGGVPEHLQIKTPPPGYETGSGRRYRNYANDGFMLWGGAGKGLKGHRTWRVFFAWRGMADADSPLTGLRSAARHTQCGFNGGNDYPVTVATIEDPAQRLRDEREGIYKTLGALYYFQHELGVNWSLAEDEGYATPYNRAKMKTLDLRPDLEALAVHLPQQPYVRECRRIIGVQTLAAKDLARFENAKHVSTSVAMGDYFMDLDHGKTAHAIEPDLDTGEAPKGGGPFQIPFEVFIPEKIDGFLPAEKNISQSRLANGATRLQPVTMLTGQAAGAIAALAVKHRVQPRALDPRQVQAALLDAGCTLIQRWYADVPWGTPLWRATQLLALHQVMDRPGAIERENHIPLAAHARWGVDEPLSPDELRRATERLAAICKAPLPKMNDNVTAGEFALIAADLLRRP